MSSAQNFNVNTTVAPPDDNFTRKATFGLTGLLVFVVIVVIVIAVRQCRRSRQRSSSIADDQRDVVTPNGAEGDYERGVFVSNEAAQSKSEMWNREQWSHLAADIKCILKGHVIDRERVRLGNIIGKGEFGCVYEALLLPGQLDDYSSPVPGQKVAVKTLNKAQCLTDDGVESFLKEGMIMRAFNHSNVLSLIGVAIDDVGVPLIVVPFMQNGSLKKYIMTSSLVFTVRELLTFGHEVASGMMYLSELKFVHRDLATRNCMLDENLSVKVADFGLSRDLYSRDYYASGNRLAKLPVRWMAPESLSQGRYSVKSDAWSFGVLLWELLTRGSIPYSDIGNWDVQPFVLSGQRLSQPEVCPDDVYSLMLQCWSSDASDRPTFAQLCHFFQSLLDADLISNNDDYVNLTASVDLQSSNEASTHSTNTCLFKTII